MHKTYCQKYQDIHIVVCYYYCIYSSDLLIKDSEIWIHMWCLLLSLFHRVSYKMGTLEVLIKTNILHQMNLLFEHRFNMKIFGRVSRTNTLSKNISVSTIHY